MASRPKPRSGVPKTAARLLGTASRTRLQPDLRVGLLCISGHFLPRSRMGPRDATSTAPGNWAGAATRNPSMGPAPGCGINSATGPAGRIEAEPGAVADTAAARQTTAISGPQEATMATFDRELSERIQAVVGEYLAANGGGFANGWHFVADFIDSDGEDSWLYSTAPDQKAMTTIGLIEWARDVARYEQRNYLDSLDDGE